MWNKEPTVILGALAEVFRQIIPMLIIFGFIKWTGEQVAQVGLVIGVVVGFFNILLTRSQVASPATVQTALNMPAGSTIDLLSKVVAADVVVEPGDTKAQVVSAVNEANKE